MPRRPGTALNHIKAHQQSLFPVLIPVRRNQTFGSLKNGSDSFFENKFFSLPSYLSIITLTERLFSSPFSYPQ